jgi:hypothetical protein
MIELHEQCIREYLSWQGIDIYIPNFQESKAYNKIKDRKALCFKEDSITFEKYIGEYLLKGKHCTIYESKYDMDCPYDSEYMYSEEDMAQKILMAMGDFPEDTDVNDEKSIEAGDMIEAGKDLVKAFHRCDCGLIERLKKYFKFDLTSFDTKDDKYEYEKCKILYFFYMLEKMYFPDTNVLELLSKPSMENVRRTYNGMILIFIKESLNKELGTSLGETGLPKGEDISWKVKSIVEVWNGSITYILSAQDYLYSVGSQYNFEEYVINALKSDKKIYSPYSPVCTVVNKTENTSVSSTQEKSEKSSKLIECLFLKIVEFAHIGFVKDIMYVNDIERKYQYSDISDEMVEEMNGLSLIEVEIKEVERYINENAKRLSRYVYLKSKTSSEEVRKIKNSSKKVIRFFKVCWREDCCKGKVTGTEIVAVLQSVILDDQNETFDYSYHASQKQMKHKPRVQGALKNDNYVIGALNAYWCIKVDDRWYMNVGRKEQQIRLRKIHQTCNNILLEILSKDSVTEMIKFHRKYFDNFKIILEELPKRIRQVEELIAYLHNDEGFENTDKTFYDLIPFFNKSFEYIKFSFCMNEAIQNVQTKAEVTDEGKKFVFTFDYEKRTCSLSIQEISLDEKG